jgi:hypothetical protein
VSGVFIVGYVLKVYKAGYVAVSGNSRHTVKERYTKFQILSVSPSSKCRLGISMKGGQKGLQLLIRSERTYLDVQVTDSTLASPTYYKSVMK